MPSSSSGRLLLVYTESLLFIVAAFISEFSCMDWILCHGVTSAPAGTPVLSYRDGYLLQEQTPASNLSSAPSPFSQPSQNWGDRALLWIRFSLEGILWLIWSTIQTCFFYISGKAVLLSCHPYVYRSLTFNFFQEPSLCIHSWLTGTEAVVVWLGLAFDIPFITNLKHFELLI